MNRFKALFCHFLKVFTQMLNLVRMIFCCQTAVGNFDLFCGGVRGDAQDHTRVMLHGPWIAGLMLTWLSWFMLLKGLKSVSLVKWLKENTLDNYGVFPVLIFIWFAVAMAVQLALLILKGRGTRNLFSATAVLGMICMAFAFGQNDLANCASPGLSAWWLYRHADQSVAAATAAMVVLASLITC